MIVVTLQRARCTGCGYCVDAAPEYFSMDACDGKCTLAGAVEKKGFYTLRTGDTLVEEPCRQAADRCPSGGLQVKRVD